MSHLILLGKRRKRKRSTSLQMALKNRPSVMVFMREKNRKISWKEDNGAGVVQPICSYSELDYTYEMLIDKLFSTLRENNPQLEVERRRLILRPPRVLKTILANFMDYCKKMNRQPDHLMNFLLTELGVGGSLDG